jgi:energy-converting hydrogenase Eha subunit C
MGIREVPWGLVFLVAVTVLVAVAVSNLLLAGTFLLLAALMEVLVQFGKSRNLLPGNEWVVRVLFLGILLMFLGAAQKGLIAALTGVEPVDIAITAAIASAVVALVTYAVNYLLHHKLRLPAPRRAALLLERSEWVE